MSAAVSETNGSAHDELCDCTLADCIGIDCDGCTCASKGRDQ